MRETLDVRRMRWYLFFVHFERYIHPPRRPTDSIIALGVHTRTWRVHDI